MKTIGTAIARIAIALIIAWAALNVAGMVGMLMYTVAVAWEDGAWMVSVWILGMAAIFMMMAVTSAQAAVDMATKAIKQLFKK